MAHKTLIINSEKDLVQVTGSFDTVYANEVVWAKEEDYPWHPGWIDLTEAEAMGHHQKLTVNWFGTDYKGKSVRLAKDRVRPWVLDDMIMFKCEVVETDFDAWMQAVVDANKAWMESYRKRLASIITTTEDTVNAMGTVRILSPKFSFI